MAKQTTNQMTSYVVDKQLPLGPSDSHRHKEPNFVWQFARQLVCTTTVCRRSIISAMFINVCLASKVVSSFILFLYIYPVFDMFLVVFWMNCQASSFVVLALDSETQSFLSQQNVTTWLYAPRRWSCSIRKTQVFLWWSQFWSILLMLNKNRQKTPEKRRRRTFSWRAGRGVPEKHAGWSCGSNDRRRR